MGHVGILHIHPRYLQAATTKVPEIRDVTRIERIGKCAGTGQGRLQLSVQTDRWAEKDVVGPAAIYLVPPWFLEYLNHVPCIQVPVVVQCFLRVYDVLRVW